MMAAVQVKSGGRSTAVQYLLGVADEEITATNRHLVSWSTSKLGGRPDFMSAEATIVRCKMCDQEMVLVVQVYAPIDAVETSNNYHRTLYLFACLVCSSMNSDTANGFVSDSGSGSATLKSECWRVVRSQRLESVSNPNKAHQSVDHQPVDWLDTADDWGPMDEDVEGDLSNECESTAVTASSSPPSSHRDVLRHRCAHGQGLTSVSCEDDEDEAIQLQQQQDGSSCPDILDDGHYSMTMRSVQQPNLNVGGGGGGGDKQLRNHANTGVDEQGNVAARHSNESVRHCVSGNEYDEDDDCLSENVQSKLHVSDSMEGAVGLSHDCEAEVEPPDDATSVVTVDTPSVPSRECIAALFGGRLSDDTSPPPLSSSSSSSPPPPPPPSSMHCLVEFTASPQMAFKSMFLAVIEEPLPSVQSSGDVQKGGGHRSIVLDDHERELLVSYQRQEGMNINELYNRSHRLESSGGESYEKYFVKHRDREFKKMQNRLRLCPQQLLRYCRDAGAVPLLISSIKGEETLASTRGRCDNCGGDTVFELQILPTAIDYLKVVGIQDCVLEFGTVVVYTCRASCWSSDAAIPFVEEKVVVIADPDELIFEDLKRRAAE